MSNLTTTSRFKRYAGITGSAKDTLLDALLPLVSGEIETFLMRTLALTTYRQWVNGTGSSILRLRNWPVLSVYHCAISSSALGYVQYTGTDATRATVAFDGVNVTLFSIGSDGSDTATSLPIATYKTLGTLATAIQNVSGWQATISSTYTTQPTSMLRPIYGQDALTDNRADLLLPDVSSTVKVIGDDVVEIASADDAAVFPTDQILRVTVPLTSPATMGVGFPSGYANVFVWYTAGYTLPTDGSDGTLPPGLELITFQILQDTMKSRNLNAALRSESIGGYSYSLGGDAKGAVGSAIEARKKDLNRYRKVLL